MLCRANAAGFKCVCVLQGKRKPMRLYLYRHEFQNKLLSSKLIPLALLKMWTLIVASFIECLRSLVSKTMQCLTGEKTEVERLSNLVKVK